MSNTTPTPSRGTDATDESHFTVEDAGSTTDAADLFHNDTTAGLSTPSDTAGAGAERRTETETRPQQEGSTASSGPAIAVGRTETTTSASTGSATDSGDAPGSVPAPTTPGAPEAPSAPSGGLAALIGDDSIAHVFDQTNGVIDRLDGDSDGTAAADADDAADPTGGRTVRPIGQQDAFHEDHYGADDGRDPNR